MSFNGKLFNTLAYELINKQQDPNLKEAYFRTAISRSYYSVHWIARKLLSNVPKTGQAHQYVIDGFKNSIDRNRKKIGKNLERLRTNRSKADYKKNSIIDKNLSDTQYSMAKNTLDLLDLIAP